jgi:hypothetical protein
MLRDPRIVQDRGPLELASSRIGKNTQSVLWSANWATDFGAFEQTKQRFWTRGWRVTCQTQDQAEPVVVYARDSASPPPAEDPLILNGAARLKVDIDPSYPSKITVRFQCEDRFVKQFEEMKKRLKGLEDRYGTRFGRGLAGFDERVQEVEMAINTRRQGKEGTTSIVDRTLLNEDRDALQGIREIATKDSLLRALEEGEGRPQLKLSVIVYLVPETGVMADVARFGEVETPKP